MNKQDIKYTIIFMVISHLVITICTSLIFGIRHPLSFFYVQTEPVLFVLASLLIIVPLYMLAGFIFILAKHQIKNMGQIVFKCSLYFSIGLIVFWGIGVLLAYQFYIIDLLSLYILLNYPAALIYNTIDLNADGYHLVLMLTAIVPAMSFYLGAIARIYMSKKEKEYV